MIRVGRVLSNIDQSSGGIIKIQPLDSNGDVLQEEYDALPCTPNLGDGYGFLSVPGPGALVLFVEIPNQTIPGNQHPFRFAWIGVVGSVVTQIPGTAAFSNDKNDPDETDNTQKQNLGQPGNPEKLRGLTGPEPENLYADTGHPQQDIFKSKAGHKLVLSKKITPQGTHDNSILLQSASGKGLRIDDGPPELKMDKISLRDETSHGEKGERGPNRFEIITHEDKAELITERDQVHITHSGGQEHLIMQGTQSQTRTNLGKGDIVDMTAYGNHVISSQKNISRTSHEGDITYEAKGGDIISIVAGNIVSQAAGNIISEAVGTVTITSDASLNLVCGGSIVNITPASVSITSPLITLTSPLITLNGQTVVSGAATVSGGLGVQGIDFGTHTHGGVLSGTDFTFPPL